MPVTVLRRLVRRAVGGGLGMLISIILPTIRTSTVAHAIEAILRQTDGNWELIVVPQGDDKALIQLLDAYCVRDPRVRYVHTPKKNLSHGRNVGMPATRGDIIAFTDDDCEVAPDWIAGMREIYAQNPDISYLGGEVVAHAQQAAVAHLDLPRRTCNQRQVLSAPRQLARTRRVLHDRREHQPPARSRRKGGAVG